MSLSYHTDYYPMDWNYPDGFDPRQLDQVLDFDADTDALAHQILENDSNATCCTLFDAGEYLFDFFDDLIPPDFLEEFAQATTKKIQTLRAQK